MPASPTMSWPEFIHSPPLTIDAALAAGRLADVGGAVGNARGDAQQVERARAPGAHDHAPFAVICSRFSTVPLLPAVCPMTRAFDRCAGERQRATHQGEQALPRAAHDRLR